MSSDVTTANHIAST